MLNPVPVAGLVVSLFKDSETVFVSLFSGGALESRDVLEKSNDRLSPWLPLSGLKLNDDVCPKLVL